jgi:hypothetical protein
MPTLNFVDRYSSTLSAGYTAGGTSLSVASASGLPSGACNFYVIVQAEGANTEEVFQVTNVSGTALTVAYAQAGTANSNHASGAVVLGSIMTAAAFAQLKTDMAGSSSSIASGAPICPVNNAAVSNIGGWNNYSLLCCIPGPCLRAYPASWKMAMRFVAGSPVIGAIVCKRTLHNSMAVIDSTVLTIGGSAAPTLTTPGYVTTDAISLQLDNTHDYWVILYFTNAGANSTSTGFVNSGLQFLRSGYVGNDQTGVTTIPAPTGATPPFLFIGPVMP